MPARQTSDGSLVKRCRAGDHEAWIAIVDRYSRYVYAIAVRAFRLSDADAEDVFQEVFTRAYERLDTLRDDGALKPWIGQMTRNLCIDHIRSRSREDVAEEPLDPADSEDVIGRLDAAMAVREAMGHLPENCNDILDRFFARDQSYRAIGEQLSIPPGTIASRISRCLAKLKSSLGEAFA